MSKQTSFNTGQAADAGAQHADAAVRQADAAAQHADAAARQADAGATTRPLAPALGGERFMLDGLNCYVGGDGPPLLLVHSVNAAASAAEVRPLFDRYRASHTVYAVDLPGFGLSARPDVVYTPRLMTDALHALNAEIRRRSGSSRIDALGVSLGCEFVARAALEQPLHWRRLALVSPTGLDGHTPRRGKPGSSRKKRWLYALLSNPAWAQPLFNALTRPGVVRYFLQRTWGSKAIDEPVWAYAVQSARQPGARFAPLHFLSGGLFSADIHRVYENLSQPVWMGHGTRGDFTDFRAMSLLRGFAWRFTVFPSGAMPYFELPGQFAVELDKFLGAARPDAESLAPFATRESRLVPAP